MENEMTPIEQAIEALEDACGNRCNAEYNPCQYREAIDALRAQTAIPEHIKSIRIPTRAMEQEFQNHYRRGFEAGKKSAQPDHSELVKELRSTIGLDRLDDDDNVALVPRWIVEQAANALEGKL